MSFYDWWYHQHVYRVMFTNLGETSDSSQYGLGPSDELLRLAFKHTEATEVEYIDPSLLQLDLEQPDGEGMPTLLDHADECKRGSGDLASPEDVVSVISESTVNIDEDSPGTTEVPIIMVTDEQSSDRTDVRELVNNHGTSKSPEAPSSLEPEVQHPQGASSHAPLSSAPHPPSHAAPPPVPLYTEAGVVGLRLSGRVVQAWGTHDGRQYLIRWEGLPPEFDSWVLAINISGQLVAEFERCLLRYRIN